MQVLKRNQIIILVVALMLVSAGYLNFATRQKDNTITTSAQDANLQVAGIGDAKLVSSNGVVDQNELGETSNNNTSNSTSNNTSNNTSDNTPNNASNTSESNVNEQSTLTSNNSIEENNLKENQTQDTSNYFSSSRLNRETMYSQMIESYQEILENGSISETQKAIAQIK